MITGCAATETPKVKTLVYPPLPYHKIHPPKEGCLVGFYSDPEVLKDPIFKDKMKERSAKARNRDEYIEMVISEKDFWLSMDRKYPIGNNIIYYENALGAKPFIFVLSLTPRLFTGFPVEQATAIAQMGAVPYVNASPGFYFSANTGFGVDEIAQGRRDSFIREFALSTATFGKENGGFFFTTMIESNGRWFYWGQDPNFIPAWRHIWQIFEDEGVNQYATWVWEAYCPEGVPGYGDDPELYYPGDKYVDWIGLNAFSAVKKPKTDYALDVLIHRTYRRLLDKHPQKPIMLSEFGRTNRSDQAAWLQNAYRGIKKDFPAIKAATCYDNATPEWFTGDHTLNPKSLETLKEIFKDPYWVMGK
jgi:hypothetical protein